jgi:hypothetical protein
MTKYFPFRLLGVHFLANHSHPTAFFRQRLYPKRLQSKKNVCQYKHTLLTMTASGTLARSLRLQ